jgi:hypothetical protein
MLLIAHRHYPSGAGLLKEKLDNVANGSGGSCEAPGVRDDISDYGG